MAQRFESAAADVSDKKLLIRGVVLLAVTALLTWALIAKSEGTFSRRVTVTALLTHVGDGLPHNSDVKFRGALVGVVEGVSPALDGGENTITLSLDPQFAKSIPATVTARVVPSNVFAVSSIQLIDNGPAAGLHAGSLIHEDQSLSTIQFQTSLTKLRDIVAAASRPGAGNPVGILATVAAATDRRGRELSHAGGAANRIVNELNAVMAPDGTQATLSLLSEALQGLQSSAPELLDAVHHAVLPMRTIAEKRQGLADFLSGGLTTFGTVGTAFENNTDQLIRITTQLSPVLGVMADGGGAFEQITTSIKKDVDGFMTELWRPEQNIVQGKFLVVFTPNQMYTRDECPRYGQLEGPSCQTAPETTYPPTLPRNLDPRNYSAPPELVGGNVGLVGSPEERELLTQLLGPDTNPAAELLIGPIARGSTVQVIPDPTPAPRDSQPGTGDTP